MDRTFGSDSMPSGPVNKHTVLTVKPLRCLVPVFPVQPDSNAPPTSNFASVPPTGPFPPGAAPFFPFYSSNGSQNKPGSGRGHPIPSPVPISSFKSPVSKNGDVGSSRRTTRAHTLADEDDYSQSDGFENSFDRDNVEIGSDGNVKKQTVRRKTRNSGENVPDVDLDPIVAQLLRDFNLLEIDTRRQADSDKEYVDHVLVVYNLLRRKIAQLDDTKPAKNGAIRRADLKAGTLLMYKGARANAKKRFGGVAGVEIGDIFFFRMEICLVGLHAPSMAGIDYMGIKASGEDEPLAVSIVSSGGYDDEGDDGEVLIYSGQGGVQRKDKQVMDQQLVRGNLALEKSLHRANEVRVIRGLKDVANPTGKVYVYDGLYRIHESWIDKAKSGVNVFKYKLVRVPGQPEAFTLWKSIQLWKDGVTVRPGLILPDLTSGAESQPVCLVNEVDNEKGPSYFTYIKYVKYTKPFPVISSSSNCGCSIGCQPSTNCPCVQRNGGYMPYTSLGVLMSHNMLIHECSSSCDCPHNCRNRISQAGLKVRLEVFKTSNKGWGLRSWDPIRAGGFICEYAGVVQENVMDFDDDYVFDATRSFAPIEPMPSEEPVKFPYPLIISAKNEGNVGRFMNHSCSPNVYWQPIVRENVNGSYLHIGFYAIKHIPPMQELTYSYGMVSADRGGSRRKTCLCGSSQCNGYFY
ncbi:histone-lysine N-methyltransferase, H3 lysine-9 specific SUVH1-like [Rutidosis leptorrhynchoides]|uniref:histone-lysine N-methyltransferase, H3 lysine-9 specific SUVH1-like n=1 Tax=Rutidosis leptorrhynchoides TaxID=125765 RepID=UPI003A99A70D